MSADIQPSCLIWGSAHNNNDTQHNDTQHNDAQHYDTQHYDTQHNDTQHNDTQHIEIQCKNEEIETVSIVIFGIIPQNPEC
jgi:hypothetical protein